MKRLCLLACVMFMGAKGCIGIPAHDYINTAYFSGQYYAFPEEVPSPRCASDPFALDSYLHLRDRISMQMDGVLPAIATGEIPDAAVPGVAHYTTVLGPWPATFTITRTQFRDGTPYHAYTWTTSGYAESPLSCFAAHHVCPYLSIVTVPDFPVQVQITSGWQDFNTGESCWNVWPSRFLTCHQDGSHDPDWWECYLPLNDAFDGGIPQ